MSSKHETPILLLTLLITAGLLGSGIWWFTQQNHLSLSGLLNPSGGNSSSPESSQREPLSSLATVKRFTDVTVPKGLINYGGGSSWAEIRRMVDPEVQKAVPNFQLRYTQPLQGAPSTTSGIAMLLRSELDFAQASRPISQAELAEAEKRGFKLKEIPIAIDGLAVVVHPSLPIEGLTMEQYEAIFAGKITNWRSVGGPDLKIQLYGKTGRDQAPLFSLTSTTTEALRKVGTDPGGIYTASASLLVPQCGVKALLLGHDPQHWVPPYKETAVKPADCGTPKNQVNIAAFRSGLYPLSRRLTVVVKQTGRFDQEAGEAYANLLLTAQGQDLLAAAGFVNLR
jgi:phosphate transport system substrate-binding protein